MLPQVKPHTFRVLQLLDDRALTNHVLVITRSRVNQDDCMRLNEYSNIRITLLVTHSGIADKRIEPVDSMMAARSLTTAYEHAERYRVVFYWRPIVPGLNDSDADIGRALELSASAHATVYTGLFYRDEIRRYYEAATAAPGRDRSDTPCFGTDGVIVRRRPRQGSIDDMCRLPIC